jgi:hypothetical protein
MARTGPLHNRSALFLIRRQRVQGHAILDFYIDQSGLNQPLQLLVNIQTTVIQSITYRRPVKLAIGMYAPEKQ